MLHNRLTVLAVSAAALVFTASSSSASDKAVGAGNDWPGVGGAPDESSYSRLDQINLNDIGKLGLAWSLDLPGEVSLEATPLEVEGTIYFTGSEAKVYAVDARTGEIKWTYDPQVWKHNPDKMHFSFGANRGMAYENGKVFAAALDGRLFGFDAKTGRLLWEADSIPAGMLNVSTGAPRVMNGKVIIGNGGTAWNGMTFDPELDRVYIGTGNSGPYDPTLRDPGGGDDLYNTSIVALDAKTGKYIWHYQENQRDCWDYKSTPNIVMATIPINGQPREVLLHAPTNGFFYVLDRRTGKLLNEPGKTTDITWAKNIDLKTGR